MPAPLPLLLVPGLTCSARLYAPQVAALWPRAPIMVADHRQDDHIDAVARRILDNAPPRFSLAGLSMGGYIAFAMMRLAPERIARLALLDTSARADTPEQMAARNAQIAMTQAGRFAEQRVVLFEEPVSSDDLEGLRLLRDRAPPGMMIAAGEYGYTPIYFRRMLQAGAVDVLQADATRCGVTGFLAAAALAEAFTVPLSAHTAPTLHAQIGCACRPLKNIEYFHDHARIETMLFDGAITPSNGMLAPDRTRPGLGIDLKRADAERFRL